MGTDIRTEQRRRRQCRRRWRRCQQPVEQRAQQQEEQQHCGDLPAEDEQSADGMVHTVRAHDIVATGHALRLRALSTLRARRCALLLARGHEIRRTQEHDVSLALIKRAKKCNSHKIIRFQHNLRPSCEAVDLPLPPRSRRPIQCTAVWDATSPGPSPRESDPLRKLANPRAILSTRDDAEVSVAHAATLLLLLSFFLRPAAPGELFFHSWRAAAPRLAETAPTPSCCGGFARWRVMSNSQRAGVACVPF